MKHPMIVVGIAGGTGSGKTTITRQVQKAFGDEATVINHDNYYRAHHNMSWEEKIQLNYDHPDAFETDLLVEHIKELKEGRAIQCPVYDYSIHDRLEETTLVVPSNILIVEGILIFENQQLRDSMDIKVYVDTDADVRILRRILRDVKERGRTLDSVIQQYLLTVKPMHEAFVEPSKRYADVIIPEGGRNQVAIEMVISRLRAHMRELHEADGEKTE